MCQRLISALSAHQIRQRDLVKALGISAAAVCLLVNRGAVPARNRAALLESLQQYLIERGCPEAEASAVILALQPAPTDEGEEPMIIRKQTLFSRTRQHFKLTRNPFDDPQCPEDVFLSPESRYVRECLYDAAVNGNFLAVVGESGSGKSTLREELAERLQADGDSVILIEPYTLTMSSSEKTGKPLRAQHILEAILATVSPSASTPSSPQARAAKVHAVLRDSSKAGFRHCLILEEAHDLHLHTLKSLKRFWEMKNGMKRLLSIILIGQTELGDKLTNTQSDVREVVQRCDVVRLHPINDPAEFLRHRFSRAGANLDAAFEPTALTALHERLLVSRDMRGRGVYMGYPLAITNFAIAALNTAAELGERAVTADVVRQVRP